MKKTILSLAIITFMAGTISITNGQKPDKKSVEARENLKEAQKDSISEYQKFKKESEIKIKDNEQSITDLKVKHSKMTAKDNANYQEKVSALEAKNNNLKKKLTDYNKDGEQDKWTSFKNEFNHDMNELGKALKDFTVRNKK